MLRSVPGTTGAPAAMATRRAEVFDPILRIASAGGPMNTIPADARGLREIRVLAQEAVAGMNRFRLVPLAASMILSMRR